jgi:hypothetical protein
MYLLFYIDIKLGSSMPEIMNLAKERAVTEIREDQAR